MRSAPLAISTPDGSGQAVHPDVVDAGRDFAGHRFWMAMTPYPFGDDQQENPCIRVSDDGLSWLPLPGAPDPLVPPPVQPDRHWSDTDLVLHDGLLHVFFRGCERGGGRADYLVVTSPDGVTWSEPRIVWTGDDGVSPAFVRAGAEWLMWHVVAPAGGATGSRIVCQRSADLTGWSAPEVCDLDLPGHVAWHIDVIAADAGFEALVSAFPARANMSRCRLFHATSPDGRTFGLSSRQPVLRPQAGRWCSRMIYRSTFTRDGDGSYRVWYSGASWGMRCGIGYAEGPMSALRVVNGPAEVPASVRAREDMKGWATYLAIHRTPDPVKRVLRRVLPGR